MHKVFISYHHANDQAYKDHLLDMNKFYPTFINASVDTGDINENLSDAQIREIIRDQYLKDSTVTIVLVGSETKYRKHVDWEIYSSMYDGKINKKSGIFVINLPTIQCNFFEVSHIGEKECVYPENPTLTRINERKVYENMYPYMPDRIIDNLLRDDVKISVVNWEKIDGNFRTLDFLINATCNDKSQCNYDFSRPMKRSNS